jgi:methylmalonyl-CoA/ethylmalonyl-CoA epimerase
VSSAPLSITQVAVNVHDLARATDFYRDVLRLPFLFDAPGMAFFDCGGVRIMLAVAGEARFDHPASLIYYNVADLDEAFAHCVAHAARVERAPHRVHEGAGFELWMAFVHDTEGNLLALVARRPLPATGASA